MSEEAQAESVPSAEPAPAESSPEQESASQAYNIFSDKPSEVVTAEEPRPVEEPKKSKQFLENLRHDKEVRRQKIALKERQVALDAREKEVQAMVQMKEKMNEDPSEFLRSQGIDPIEYYRKWTEQIISEDAGPTVESKISNTQKELNELKQKIAEKENAEAESRRNASQSAAYNSLCGSIEKYATSVEGYGAIKETCTAKDVANGMIQHYRQTGEEMTVEEAFEKIEAGLREREESFYSDPKVLSKLQKYNPEAFRTAKGPQATLSAKWKEQPTRKDPDEMSYEEIRDHWKGKLFT
jgi:vacuolar-type H+-ATPase subunit I/STV1